MKRWVQERRFPLFFFLVILGALTLLTSCGGGLPSASWYGIAVSGDTVYLAAHDKVLALNLDGGAELWSAAPEFDDKEGFFYAVPLLTEDTLIVGDFANGMVYALSQGDGGQEWTVETEGRIVAGAVSLDGGFIVGDNEGILYRIEKETLEKRVFLETEEPIWAAPLVDEANGRIYVPSMDHHLYALNLESGEQVWTPFDAGGALAGTPALDDGVLYFGALNGTFYALDAETGQKLWDFDTEGWAWGGPLAHDGAVYFGDMAGYLYALDATDGSERWPAFKVEGGVRATPVLSDGLIYLGTRQKKVYAINAEDGTQQWTLQLAGSIYSQPVIYEDYLLISPHNAKVKLIALNRESGAELWTYPPREE